MDLTRPISQGEMYARGEVVLRSKRLFMVESVLTNSDDEEIARGSGTFMVRNIPLVAKIGYQ